MKKVLLRNVIFWNIVLVALCSLAADENTSAAPVEPARNDAGLIIRNDLRPIDDLDSTLGGRDPIEGFNRVMFVCGDFFTKWIFRPVAYGYGTIMPQPGVDAINRFTDNVAFPGRMMSCFLQAKFGGGGVEVLRFLTNTTVGIAGFFDPAKVWFDLNRQNEDFGQAFASWGIGPGCYLYLPGEGGSNVRDGVGKIFDYALDIKTYFYGGQAFTKLNTGVSAFQTYDTMSQSSFDMYHDFKDLNLISRQAAILDYQAKYPEESEYIKPFVPPVGKLNYKVVKLDSYPVENPYSDTLRASLFDSTMRSTWPYLSAFNGSFRKTGDINEVEIFPEQEELRYQYFPCNEDLNAPLVVILPGLGGSYVSGTVVALAEFLNKQGFAVVALPNAMNWRFVLGGMVKNHIPGYTPNDVEFVQEAIKATLKDLELQESIQPKSLTLLGYSMGALHTLFISANEIDGANQGDQVVFDRYIAINPPVDLLYSLRKLDEFYAIGDKWDETQAEDQMLNDFVRIMRLLGMRDAQVGYWGTRVDLTNNGNVPVKFDESDSKFIIGYSFKRSLSELIMAMEYNQNPNIPIETPVSFGNRHEAYREIATYDYNKYLNDILLPYYENITGSKVSLDKINFNAGLHAKAEGLRKNNKIRVFHNQDDFIISEDDLAWLGETLGDRLTVFDHGGHLGNFFEPTVQKEWHQALPEPKTKEVDLLQ